MDVPKDQNSELSVPEFVASEQAHIHLTRGPLQRFTSVLTRWGVETNGYAQCLATKLSQTTKLNTRDATGRIDPILPSDRTDDRLYQLFFVWFTSNMNVLA